MRYFVTAIGTNCGKTLCSAMLCEAFNANYWKPVQAGRPTDSEILKSLISNTYTKIYPEKYILELPASPHHAAKVQNIEIDLETIVSTHVVNSAHMLIIEGAGGVLTPLNEIGHTMADLIAMCNAEVILVSRHYLGSINHTLLTINELKQRKIPIRGLVFNGKENKPTENIILQTSQLPFLFRIHDEPIIDPSTIAKYKEIILDSLT